MRPGPDEARLRGFQAVVPRVDAFAPRLERESDDGLRTIARLLQARAGNGADLDALLPEAFALAREAAARALGQRPWDVQLVVAAALHAGTSVGMAPGEGKTLAIALATYLNALPRTGVHVVAPYEHTNERAYQAMAPLYRFLGIEAALLRTGDATSDLRDAYAAAVTYGAHYRFALDLMGDAGRRDPGHDLQRGHRVALVDDADTVLGAWGRTQLKLQASPERGGKVWDEVTPIGYFRRYDRIGLVSTAATGSIPDLHHSFGLATVDVPRRFPQRLRRRFPLVADTLQTGLDHIEERVRAAPDQARPVVVSVQTEELAASVRTRLAARGIDHARFDATVVDQPDVAGAEQILGGAGRAGALTVFTGFFPGLDVPLGGPEGGDERERVIATGGLLVLRLATDLEAMAKPYDWAARRGEPGEVQEVLLIDPLAVRTAWWSRVARYAARRVSYIMREPRPGLDQLVVGLHYAHIARRFERLNRPVYDFDALVDHQRELNYGLRRAVANEDAGTLRDRTAASLHAAVARLAATIEDAAALRAAVAEIHPVGPASGPTGNGSVGPAALAGGLVAAYDARRVELGIDALAHERRAHRWAVMGAWSRHLDGVRAIRDRLQEALPMGDEGLMRGLREVARRFDEIEADLPVECARLLFRDDG
jgi:preprotein translocase subunit SecA